MPVEETVLATLLERLAGVSKADATLQVDRWRRWPLSLRDNHPRTWRWCSKASFAFFGPLTKLVVPILTRHAATHNLDQLQRHREPTERGLITVANHISTLDDPGMWVDLPMSDYFGDLSRMRHTLIADDICQRRLAHSLFFGLAQGIPVVRGAGVYQHGMDYAIELLNQKQWIHLFPGGAVDQSGKPRRLKWGVGRLIWESQPTPMVVPIHIQGWDRVKSLKQWPSLGHDVTITIGEPLDLTRLVEELRNDGADDTIARKVLTDAVQAAMEKQSRRTQAA
eukprot:TRINITY_DN11956_c0_g3_i1.p2 TRINITY_DN11956_c0_g3~~TRINITY_DN11956_c0_g3_i1.p2  ORF type:complete len:281 (+),score=30.95 TRINITY_DN11956_c0_g3_i1:1222-2064(+)